MRMPLALHLQLFLTCCFSACLLGSSCQAWKTTLLANCIQGRLRRGFWEFKKKAFSPWPVPDWVRFGKTVCGLSAFTRWPHPCSFDRTKVCEMRACAS